MNGGQVATRGFLLQTLIALLDTLGSLAQIKSLRLEPSTDEDKTDFVLEYTNGRKKAVQVKSSQNQIGLLPRHDNCTKHLMQPFLTL